MSWSNLSLLAELTLRNDLRTVLCACSTKNPTVPNIFSFNINCQTCKFAC